MKLIHHLELHQKGTRELPAVAPRDMAIGADELHIGIGGAVYDTYDKSVSLSRSQVQDLFACPRCPACRGHDGDDAESIADTLYQALRTRAHRGIQKFDGFCASRDQSVIDLEPHVMRAYLDNSSEAAG